MSDTAPPLLALEDLTYGFPGRPNFLKPVRAKMNAGEFWGVVGPNGAGKSTVLRLAAGLRKPTSGRVRLRGTALDSMSPIARARSIAFLPQSPSNDLPLPVSEIVLMGRFPHRRFGMFEDSGDRSIARDAMIATDTLPFAERSLSTLSGGEAQRVHIAAALAQQPGVMLLDEPTASLDWRHQLAIFELLRTLSTRDGLLVVTVTHDLNLAARFCTHVILLDDGRCAAMGPPAEVLRPDVLEPVYRVRLKVASTDEEGSGSCLVPFRVDAGQGDNAVGGARS